MGRPRSSKVADWDQVTVRLPPGMRDKINEIATQNGRSANAEIVSRLERTFTPTETPEVQAIRSVFREELDRAVTLILEGK